MISSCGSSKRQQQSITTIRLLTLPSLLNIALQLTSKARARLKRSRRLTRKATNQRRVSLGPRSLLLRARQLSLIRIRLVQVLLLLLQTNLLLSATIAANQGTWPRTAIRLRSQRSQAEQLKLKQLTLLGQKTTALEGSLSFRVLQQQFVQD